MDRPMAEIMESALAAGWELEEIEAAARSLAENFRGRIEANAETERQIEEARRRDAH